MVHSRFYVLESFIYSYLLPGLNTECTVDPKAENRDTAEFAGNAGFRALPGFQDPWYPEINDSGPQSARIPGSRGRDCPTVLEKTLRRVIQKVRA